MHRAGRNKKDLMDEWEGRTVIFLGRQLPLWGIFTHTPRRQPSAAERRNRTIDGTPMSMGIRLPLSGRRIDRALGNFSINQDQPP